MFDVLADHRKNLLIQMCRVELQVGLSISFTSDFFVIGLLHLLLYFFILSSFVKYIYFLLPLPNVPVFTFFSYLVTFCEKWRLLRVVLDIF